MKPGVFLPISVTLTRDGFVTNVEQSGARVLSVTRRRDTVRQAT